MKRMKIINSNQLLEQPEGTLYIMYEPCMFVGQPMIKGEPRSKNSWWSTDVLPLEEDGNRYETFEKSINDLKFEIPTEIFCTDDATYNHDDGQLFAIFSKDEVKTMINTLMQCL